MFPYRRCNYHGQLQEDGEVLRHETGVPDREARDYNCFDVRQLRCDHFGQECIGCEDHLTASSFQCQCQRYHPSGMAETPAERAYQDSHPVHGCYPETLVAMPSRLTLWAMALSSLSGTFLRLLPSGVSRCMVYIITC